MGAAVPIVSVPIFDNCNDFLGVVQVFGLNDTRTDLSLSNDHSKGEQFNHRNHQWESILERWGGLPPTL
jgi:hypothetical protein